LRVFVFLVFKHDFTRFVDFTRIAASNRESDDATHRIFSTGLLYFFAQVVVEIYENLAIMAGFNAFNDD